MSSSSQPSTADSDLEVVGVIPAAGRGTRLQPLQCSKEIVPVGQVIDSRTGVARPKVAVEYLLEKFRHAGITRTVIVLRDGKWDIPAYLQEGCDVGLSLAYVVIPARSARRTRSTARMPSWPPIEWPLGSPISSLSRKTHLPA